LSTIRNAHVIFVFESGRIVEQGTHGELQQLKREILRDVLGAGIGSSLRRC